MNKSINPETVLSTTRAECLRGMLKYLGLDSWSRPVYEDENGILVKDVDPRSWCAPRLATAPNNEFDGEPDCPYHGETKFASERKVWR